MPISTSPYQNNDYQAASVYQPYRLQTQQIAQTALALDTFWKRGAERVKSAFDSVLNLNLTSDENKQVKDKFLEEAQAQLTKLSAGDLSNPDVQREGLNIFKPIFQDKAIMQDDHLTNLKSTIFSEADRFKRDIKTGGAGFHMDNLAYALKGFQGFNNKTARNQIGSIYEAAKDSEYVPYYDDTKEKMDIMKLCKGNKLSNTAANAGYLETYSDKSLYESKLYGCLEGALSQKSRQQNRISGSVRYGNDYQAVKQDYIDSANERKSFYTDQRDKLNAEKEALSKVAGNEVRVQELESQIKMIDDNIQRVNVQLNGNPNSNNPSERLGIIGWDDNYMKTHYEDLAANAFFKRSNGAFAQAFAITDIENGKKADPVYITHYVQDQLNRRQFADNQAAIDLENLKFRNKLALGTDEDGKKIDNLTRLKLCAQDPNCNMAQFMTEAYKDDGTNSGKIEGRINTLNAQKFDIIKDLKNDPFVKSIIGDLEIGDATSFNEENYKKAWDKLNIYANAADNADPNKKRILDVTNKLLEIDNRKTTLAGILDDAQAEVSKANPALQAEYNQKVSNLLSQAKPVTTVTGETLPASKVAAIAAGQDPDYSIVQTRGTTTQVGGQAGTYSQPTTLYQVVDRAGNVVVNNLPLAEQMIILNNTRAGSYKSALDKFLEGSTAVQRMGLSTGDLFTKGSPGERDLQTLFGQNLGIIGESESGQGVVFSTIGGVDPLTGKVKIQATNKDGQISFSKMRDAMSKVGIGSSQYGEKIDDYTMEITLPSAVRDITPLFQEPAYSDVIRLQLNYLEKKAPSLPPNGVVLQVGKSPKGVAYSIKVKKKIGSTAPEYTVLANGEESPIYNTKGMDEKENILITLDRLLHGLDNLNKQ